MKLIINGNKNAKHIKLCLLLFIVLITSSVKSLKHNNNEATIFSDSSEEIESNRVDNQTIKMKKTNLKINFKFVNISLVFPQPLEQFRLSYNQNNEEFRKSINPLLIPNSSNNNNTTEKFKSGKNFLDNGNNNYYRDLFVKKLH